MQVYPGRGDPTPGRRDAAPPSSVTRAGLKPGAVGSGDLADDGDVCSRGMAFLGVGVAFLRVGVAFLSVALFLYVVAFLGVGVFLGVVLLRLGVAFLRMGIATFGEVLNVLGVGVVFLGVGVAFLGVGVAFLEVGVAFLGVGVAFLVVGASVLKDEFAFSFPGVVFLRMCDCLGVDVLSFILFPSSGVSMSGSLGEAASGKHRVYRHTTNINK